MHTQKPVIFHEHLSRAISACKRVQLVMIDIGEMGIPDDESQQRSWQLLNVSLLNVMRLLLVVRQTTGNQENRRFCETGRTGTGEGPVSCPELDQLLSDLVDRAAIEEAG